MQAKARPFALSDGEQDPSCNPDNGPNNNYTVTEPGIVESAPRIVDHDHIGMITGLL